METYKFHLEENMYPEQQVGDRTQCYHGNKKSHIPPPSPLCEVLRLLQKHDFLSWFCLVACTLLPQFSSVAQSCLTLCNPMDCSMPGFPVHHQLPELAQIHVHWISDAIQPSHLLLSPSPPAFNLSQHQGLFHWVSSLHQVAKNIGASASASVLPMNIQSWFLLRLTSLISLQSKVLSRVFSNTTVQKHQFFSTQVFLWPNSHIHTWLLEKP